MHKLKKYSLKEPGVFHKFLNHEGELCHAETGSIIRDWYCFKYYAIEEYHLQDDNGRVLSYSRNELLDKFVLVMNVECREQYRFFDFGNSPRENWGWRDTFLKNAGTHYIRRWVDENGKQVGELELVKIEKKQKQ